MCLRDRPSTTNVNGATSNVYRYLSQYNNHIYPLVHMLYITKIHYQITDTTVITKNTPVTFAVCITSAHTLLPLLTLLPSHCKQQYQYVSQQKLYLSLLVRSLNTWLFTFVSTFTKTLTIYGRFLLTDQIVFTHSKLQMIWIAPRSYCFHVLPFYATRGTMPRPCAIWTFHWLADEIKCTDGSRVSDMFNVATDSMYFHFMPQGGQCLDLALYELLTH
jgi:hypothetical protein